MHNVVSWWEAYDFNYSQDTESQKQLLNSGGVDRGVGRQFQRCLQVLAEAPTQLEPDPAN